jgi:hypothetical protein
MSRPSASSRNTARSRPAATMSGRLQIPLSCRLWLTLGKAGSLVVKRLDSVNVSVDTHQPAQRPAGWSRNSGRRRRSAGAPSSRWTNATFSQGTPTSPKEGPRAFLGQVGGVGEDELVAVDAPSSAQLLMAATGQMLVVADRQSKKSGEHKGLAAQHGSSADAPRTGGLEDEKTAGHGVAVPLLRHLISALLPYRPTPWALGRGPAGGAVRPLCDLPRRGRRVVRRPYGVHKIAPSRSCEFGPRRPGGASMPAGLPASLFL